MKFHPKQIGKREKIKKINGDESTTQVALVRQPYLVGSALQRFPRPSPRLPPQVFKFHPKQPRLLKVAQVFPIFLMHRAMEEAERCI
jgi:hypothetical protein